MINFAEPTRRMHCHAIKQIFLSLFIKKYVDSMSAQLRHRCYIFIKRNFHEWTQ